MADLASDRDRLQTAAVAGAGRAPHVRLMAQPRRFGAVNWIGLWYLCRRDLLRAFKHRHSSLWGPAVSNLLFLAVFGLAARGNGDPDLVRDLLAFIAPGLVMFTIIDRAFELSAASILFDKLDGMIADVLQPPITPLERLAAVAAASTGYGLITGTLLAIVFQPFVHLRPVEPFALVIFAILGSLMLGLAGVVGGLWARRWEHYAAMLTFFVVPSGYLSGMFYPIDVLPTFARDITLINPIFYAIDGVRYGFSGTAQASIAIGFVFLLAVDVALAWLVWMLFRRSWRLKD